MTGEEIKAWRKARGWSQRELAEHLGVRLNSVFRWESGMHAPPGRLLDLALKHLDCTPTAAPDPGD